MPSSPSGAESEPRTRAVNLGVQEDFATRSTMPLYQGAHKRPEADPEHAVHWQVAMRPGKRRRLDRTQPLGKLKDELEKLKASIRAKVEHPFQVIKQRFGYRKTASHRKYKKFTVPARTRAFPRATSSDLFKS